MTAEYLQELQDFCPCSAAHTELKHNLNFMSKYGEITN